MSSASGPAVLSLDQIVDRYKLQRARCERLAVLVADRVTGRLRSESIRHFVSYRSKHPDDVAEKVQRKREQKKQKYVELDEDLNKTIYDLAGVRVVVYDPSDEKRVAEIVKGMFPLAPGPHEDTYFAKPEYDKRTRATRYCGTHIVVGVPDLSHPLIFHVKRDHRLPGRS